MMWRRVVVEVVEAWVPQLTPGDLPNGNSGKSSSTKPLADFGFQPFIFMDRDPEISEKQGHELKKFGTARSLDGTYELLM